MYSRVFVRATDLRSWMQDFAGNPHDAYADKHNKVFAYGFKP